jgi:hypothetical protein
MYLQIESQRTFHRSAYSRLAEWWPAALIGLVALMSGLPDANAGTLLGLCRLCELLQPLRVDDPRRGLDQRKVCEGLREVPEMAASLDVELLGV